MLWGLESGFLNGRYDALRMCQQAKAKGYGWVLVEDNDSNNASRRDAIRTACTAEGIKYGIWLTRPFTAAEARQRVVESGADGFVAEGEIPGFRPEAQNWVELVFELADLDIDKGVATNWAPFVDQAGLPDASKAKALIEGGWHCMPYVYPAEHAGITPEQQAYYARHYTHEAAPSVLDPGVGWYAIEPVFGCYGGFKPEDFPTRGNYIGSSDYAAEYVI